MPITSAPSRRSRAAIAAPIPEADPVTAIMARSSVSLCGLCGESLVEPPGHRQVAGAKKGRVEELALIAGAVVAEHGDDHVAGAERAGDADGAGDVDARGAADAQPFLGEQIEDHLHRFRIAHLQGLVDRRALEVGGDAALTD